MGMSATGRKVPISDLEQLLEKGMAFAMSLGQQNFSPSSSEFRFYRPIIVSGCGEWLCNSHGNHNDVVDASGQISPTVETSDIFFKVRRASFPDAGTSFCPKTLSRKRVDEVHLDRRIAPQIFERRRRAYFSKGKRCLVDDNKCPFWRDIGLAITGHGCNKPETLFLRRSYHLICEHLLSLWSKSRAIGCSINFTFAEVQAVSSLR